MGVRRGMVVGAAIVVSLVSYLWLAHKYNPDKYFGSLSVIGRMINIYGIFELLVLSVAVIRLKIKERYL